MPVHVPGTADTAKVALRWIRDTQQLVNTFYVFDPSGAIFSDLLTFGDDINAAVVAQLIPHMYPNVGYLGCDVEDVRTTSFSGITSFAAGGIVGTKAGGTDDLPSNVTFAIKKLTSGLGRSGRGRWYWVGMDHHDDATMNTITTTRANEMIAALVAFQTAVEAIASGLQMGIVSYFHNKVMRSSGLFEQISNWAVSDYIYDNQRRRLPGRGR